MTITQNPPRSDVERTDWVPACRVDDLEPSWGEVVLLRMRQIALFLLSPREVYAVAHEDPAGGAPVMARGIVGSRGDRPTVASPLHKEVYDLGTGECFTDPALVLRTFRTRVVGGFIEIELEAE
ncbi:nitrite reductase small subunit NirD [Leifsonia sp. fls2-241-R2A-40a]|uniref:nitrite reductase small subunit NirD n=1 Tax=Leifsonia sp. fls2-241-R2A-40a TaxID=3040290 RepID=UPI0025500770|nr:nitrite reductase small subunit NirD [Leifsonia sp. fls2-241-R2A-40a]